MRRTKAMIEETNEYLRLKLMERDKEINHLKQIVEAQSKPLSHLATLTVATERVTDALAHVIGDLTKRR